MVKSSEYQVNAMQVFKLEDLEVDIWNVRQIHSIRLFLIL
jgi:hypothetical protein